MVKTSKQSPNISSFKVNGSGINDLIFKELIKRGYSLEGNNKTYNIADSRFWYLTEKQAKAFIELEAKDPKQRMFVKKEINLLNKNFRKLTQEIAEKNINIIDLGCGDGKKALVFLKNFKNKKKIRYYPIDISPYMVQSATKTISRIKGIKVINLKNNLTSFFDLDDIAKNIKNSKFNTNFFLLLGGSLENSDVHELLHNIRAVIKDNDFLLIGNKLTHPDPTKMVSYYSGNKYIDNLLFKTLEQLGFSRAEVAYSSRFRGNRVEMFYILKNGKQIISKGKKIELKKGDKIITTISYKYNKDKLLETLNLYFNNVEMFFSEDGIYALALCKK